MILPVLPYLLVLALFAIVHRLLPPRFRWMFVLAGSLAYVAVYDFDYASGLVPALLAFWGLSWWMDREEGPRKKLVYALALGLALAYFAFYKYTIWFHRTGNATLELFGRDPRFFMQKYVVPAGMSYYVFRLVHYLVERYRGRVEKLGPLKFLHYLMFFPTFAAGPIERSERFKENIGLDDADALKEGMRRIIFGLFKTMVLANVAHGLCFPVLMDPAAHSRLHLWGAVYALAAYIYYNFAGYSDIAIGTAALLGYKIMENFDQPYLSPNLVEFWRRWHISLGYWLRDYVYIPLGGSRKGRGRHYFNYLAVMAACGLWHGGEAHYLLWGALHGAALIVNDWWRTALKRSFLSGPAFARAGTWAGIAVTFHFAALCWVIFFFDLDRAITIYRRLF
ncbi:MAG TPA: MBOAT family O-acyltransferase [bacterium]|nr:MBOAT family O-acyltransferase [bacterium]